ncbi:hypothetical protein HPP92_019429 [Vanilla planifolia]|uniref:BHLH domain-containing protein n=1 Tax=Vanilla planifolia TaxID=51239 RepID=A0A835UJU3_VANPL|nr:hypothetical protein HPP92_019429 [Vanilla planifolia]
MELHGKKKTRDFLSLYTEEPNFQPQHSRHGSQGQRPSFAVSSPPSFGSLLSSRNNEFQDNKLLMDSASRFSKGFEEEDDEGDEFGKGEGSSHKEFTVKVDTKSSELKASTPRSKHSATEQRRRSKINERFQILRALLPNSDQKRDRASFLLEVIEYIQFLQEKVQKYESFYPRWSDENSNLTSWNNQHGSGNCLADPPALNNGAASGLLASNNSLPVAPSLLSSSQNPAEPDLVAGVSYKGMENPSGFANKVAAAPPALQSNLYPSLGRANCVDQAIQRLIPEADNMVSQPDWLRSSFPAATAISSDVINEQEELEIDEGTIRISAAYSQGLLSKLSQALQTSGIDLSQASISVHINLRRLTGSRHVASSSMATPKDETEQAAKRHKSDHV